MSLPEIDGAVIDGQVRRSPARRYLVYGVIGVLAALILGLGAYYVYLFTTDQPYVVAPIDAIRSRLNEGPGGMMLLTLAKDGGLAQVYSYDVKNRALRPLVESPASGRYAITPRRIAHASSTKMVFVTNQFGTTSNQTPQVAEFDPETRQLTQVTDSDTTFKRFPFWSEVLGGYVYSAKDAKATVLGTSTDGFSLYLHASTGPEKNLGPGAFPALAPNGKTAVMLRKDGLYRLNLTKLAAEPMWDFGTTTASNAQQFALSPDGMSIAWTNPREGIVRIMTVGSWEPFVVTEMRTIDNTVAAWPVFSPDGAYLAYNETTLVEGKKQFHLVVYNILAREKKIIQDLTEFDQTKMFITDWY